MNSCELTTLIKFRSINIFIWRKTNSPSGFLYRQKCFSGIYFKGCIDTLRLGSEARKYQALVKYIGKRKRTHGLQDPFTVTITNQLRRRKEEWALRSSLFGELELECIWEHCGPSYVNLLLHHEVPVRPSQTYGLS